MKLKTFFAPSVLEAMKEIRTLYQDNALIINISKLENNQVKLLVATKEPVLQGELFQNIFDERIETRTTYFQKILAPHRFDNKFIERLVQQTLKKTTKTLDEKLLTSAFEELFHFKPIYPIENKKLYILVGNAGSGKTLTLKKMALQAKKESHKVAILTTDTIKSGATQDLKAFASLMKIPFSVVDEIKNLNEAVTLMRLSNDYILLDTPSINPYQQTELETIHFMQEQLADGEFILTMPAGLDALESIAQGALFYQAGCQMLIATMLDCSIRYNNILQTLLNNPFYLSAFCFSNKITFAPIEASPHYLTKLLTASTTKKEEDKP